MWGPWLLYINDGDLNDAARKTKQENAAWPYKWLNDADYQNRGKVTGKLVLSDGRPASGAAVFLGDENGWETNNQGTNYQYTTYADEHGAFTFTDVRRQKPYRLIAWANGGRIADVDNVFNGTMVSWGANKKVDLGTIQWPIPSREIAWQIGDFDRKTIGFKYGGAPMQHSLSDESPANLVYVIGVNKPSDWYFAQSAHGNLQESNGSES
jgi:rhamnogalacturonan endolyase